jgi:hypothetical protein
MLIETEMKLQREFEVFCLLISNFTVILSLLNLTDSPISLDFDDASEGAYILISGRQF